MNARIALGGVSAVATSIVLMVLNENDFDQTPPTDTADVVATLAVVLGALGWLVLGRLGPRPVTKLMRAAFGGLALGALLTGLASAVYDPWA